MTLKDIAKEAQVSISTVSRVLNSPGSTVASPEVQARIRAIAQREGYQPNAAARTLRQARAPSAEGRTVSILIPGPREEVAENPYFSQLTSRLEQALLDRGLTPGRRYAAGDLDELCAAPGHSADAGLIIAGRFQPAMLEVLTPRFRTIVYVGCNRLPAVCDQVVCNGFEAMADAVSYLHSLGHRKIGFIGTRCEDRIRGYREGLRRQQLPEDDRRIVNDVSLSMEGGYRGAGTLLSRAPEITAIVCANDRTAIGALRASRELGRKVPEDLSIIGTDDIEAAQFVTPPLTSIHVPLQEMAPMAVELPLNRLEGRHTLPLTVIFPHSIIPRSSCRSPRAAPSGAERP